MVKIERSKGITRIDWGFIQIKTNLINRYRYNRMRKDSKLNYFQTLVYLCQRCKSCRDKTESSIMVHLKIVYFQIIPLFLARFRLQPIIYI